MNILVCVKQVKESTDPRAASILNPSDGCAVEAALQIKAGTPGSRVTALSMGREAVSDMLRELIARGVDRALLLTDPLCAGADTLATARTLAAAAKKFGPFDLILTGRRAVDGETGLTGPRLAQLLDWPCVTNVTRIDGDLAMRDTEEETQTVAFARPALLTLCEGSYPLRLPGILGLRRAKSAVIERVSAAELGLAADECGLRGSPTQVRRAFALPAGKRHPVWLKSARELLEALNEARSRPAESKENAAVTVGRLTGSVWVVGETADAALLGRARALSGGETVFLGFGARATEAGADRVIHLAIPESHRCDEGFAARALADVIRREDPAAVLFSSTTLMRGVAPRLATLLNTGLTADCTDLQADENGLLLQIRPTWGGAQMAEIVCPEARPQMALARPGAFGRPDPAEQRREAEERAVCAESEPAIRLIRSEPAQGVRLKDADVILAGGKGLSKAAFEALIGLSARLNAQTGASRAAVDAGYAPYACQVGQTGQTVNPRVYAAIGISGAVQHVLGMSRAGTIIAVNTDPRAPIFDYADYGLIADGESVIHELMECL